MTSSSRRSARGCPEPQHAQPGQQHIDKVAPARRSGTRAARGRRQRERVAVGQAGLQVAGQVGRRSTRARSRRQSRQSAATSNLNSVQNRRWCGGCPPGHARAGRTRGLRDAGRPPAEAGAVPDMRCRGAVLAGVGAAGGVTLQGNTTGWRGGFESRAERLLVRATRGGH